MSLNRSRFFPRDRPADSAGRRATTKHPSRSITKPRSTRRSRSIPLPKASSPWSPSHSEISDRPRNPRHPGFVDARSPKQPAGSARSRARPFGPAAHRRGTHGRNPVSPGWIRYRRSQPPATSPSASTSTACATSKSNPAALARNTGTPAPACWPWIPRSETTAGGRAQPIFSRESALERGLHLTSWYPRFTLSGPLRKGARLVFRSAQRPAHSQPGGRTAAATRIPSASGPATICCEPR